MLSISQFFGPKSILIELRRARAEQNGSGKCMRSVLISSNWIKYCDKESTIYQRARAESNISAVMHDWTEILFNESLLVLIGGFFSSSPTKVCRISTSTFQRNAFSWVVKKRHPSTKAVGTQKVLSLRFISSLDPLLKFPCVWNEGRIFPAAEQSWMTSFLYLTVA